MTPLRFVYVALTAALSLALAGCPVTPTVLDTDRDGVTDDFDCDAEDGEIYPGAPDPYGDGVDQNCDGVDGVDADGDGYASASSGGDDCDDSSPWVHPDAEEIPDDYIDQDCDGADLVCDADADGVLSVECGGEDCDDANALCSLPADCVDDDADGFRPCDGDCDDGADDRYPGAPETPADGIDSDCDGVD